MGLGLGRAEKTTHEWAGWAIACKYPKDCLPNVCACVLVCFSGASGTEYCSGVGARSMQVVAAVFNVVHVVIHMYLRYCAVPRMVVSKAAAYSLL